MATEFRKGRRTTRFRARLALALAAALVVLLNLFSALQNERIFVKKRLSTLGRDSERILAEFRGHVELIDCSDGEDPMRAPVRATLEAFRDKSGELDDGRIDVSFLSTQGNAAETAELARLYGAPPNSIVVRNRDGDGFCVIPYGELVQETPGLGDADPDAVFVAEARIASAVWNVSRSSRPVVCFLQGHGEYDPDDGDVQSGYSSVAVELRKNLYTVRALELAPEASIPKDCSVLVVAGSRAELPIHAIEGLSDYLLSGGRLLLLLGGSPDPGLAGLMRRWGVSLHAPLPPGATRNGLRVASQRNPAVQFLRKAVPPTFGAAVCRLASTGESLSATSADLPRTDVLLDVRPSRYAGTNECAVAIAVERGGAGSGAALPHPTRIVVVGDAEFASNGMAGAGFDSNRDFFLACVHWLAEQELHLDRPRATYTKLRSGLVSPSGWCKAVALVVLAWPLAILLFGRLLFHRRV